mgnify:FL=1|tara:strand:- start:708 stop:1625 length:918 start_codon:yes stop_codon:yes gene_type:complete
MLNNIWKIIFLIFLLSCADDSISGSEEDLYPINPDNLDIITWNIQNYPKHSNTNTYLIDIINNLEEIDIIALQEIENANSLIELANSLEGNWEARRFQSGNSGYGNLAFLINSESIIFQEPYSILDEHSAYFAYKPPYVLEFSYNNQLFILINVHYKCCGDGNLDESDPWDEEYRRLMASFYLEEYISENFNNENVIIMGDFNDELLDAASNNVFNVFLDSPDEYYFTDLPMATEQDHWGYWSYPSWPSHLDHIIITNELFDEYQNINSSCNTILIDNILNSGWAEYDNYISDHRPVGISLDISE